MTLSLVLFAMLVAVACTAAVVCVLAARRAARCSSKISTHSATIDGWKSCEKKLATVNERVTELADNVTHLNDRYETLRTRVGMREVRAARKDDPPPVEQLTGQAWKEEMRKKLGIAISPKRSEG